ncbi:MAG TPA: hypothetical protein VGC91_17205 [Pyrinomonadaceae bacterium]|jgi:hypothetical protein
MTLTFKHALRGLLLTMLVLLAANAASAQCGVMRSSTQCEKDETANISKQLRMRRGRTSIAVKGFIGGESHNTYTFRARKGQRATVKIMSRGNGAGFSMASEGGGEFPGTSSENDTKFTATIPKTGCYSISVVAHPDARYTLTLTIR